MRWQHSRRSSNIEDRRGMRMSTAGGGGMLVLALVVFLLGGDPTALLMSGISPAGYEDHSITPEENEQADFAAAVLGNTEDVWNKLFAIGERAYEPPAMVLYSGAVQSACGFAQAAVGPFYCPLDSKLYLDLSFFDDLESQLGAPGDFARAYVVAHEVGHHVQNILGIAQQTQRAQQRLREAEANAMSVRLELQADCFAGVWAHYSDADYQLLEVGDIEEGLNAASQIGDDRLQQKSQGRVVPDSFTHGSALQRSRWFRKGFTSGNLQACDTFAVDNP